MQAWETVWVCVALTGLVLAVDLWSVFRLKRKSDGVLQARQARQQNMEYKKLEDVGS